MLKRYLLNQLVILDLGTNALIGGSPYETISERAWREQWRFVITTLDFIFGADHCRNSSEGDESQYQVFK